MVNNPSTRSAGMDGREYIHPRTGLIVPGVTTILNKIAKPALPRWAAKEVAQYAVENTDWRTLDKDNAIALLKAAPWKRRDKAAGVGTEAHIYAERLLLGKKTSFRVPDGGQVTQNIHAVIDYLKPTPIIMESTVWNERVGYAGTLDGILSINGHNYIVDWKSGKGVYPEYVLQLAAYRYADYVISADGTQTELPPIHGALILHVPIDGFASIYNVDAGEDAYHTFYAVKMLYDWSVDEADRSLLKKVTAVPSKRAIRG